MKKSVIITLIAVVLIFGCVAGGAVAWLVDQDTITNTFTVGDIQLVLSETTGDTYNMVPGATLTKDPKLTVKKDSEDCWLFIQITTSNGAEDYLSYTVADGWTQLPGTTGVFYRQQAATLTDVSYFVLSHNTVTVKDSVTQAQMATLTAENYPKLTVTAYAVQYLHFSTPEAAWAQVTT